MKIIIQKILLFLALGMILSSVSETMFYKVDIEWGYYIYFIIYGLYGYLMLLLIHHYKISSFAGLFVAASIFGFLIEGAFIGILYESLPFSLIWTSLAWHALITIVLFWYYFRKIMLGKSFKNQILYNVFLGTLLGLWGTYSWSAIEIPGSEEIIFNWVLPGAYISQIVLGYVIFIFGHMLYERTIHSMQDVSKRELHIVWGIVIVSFLIGNGLLYFPFSLVLPVIIYICLHFLKKDTIQSEIISHEIDKSYIRDNRYFITLLIPVSAACIYYLFFTYKIELEMNALYFVIGGCISVYLFFKSIFALRSQKIV